MIEIREVKTKKEQREFMEFPLKLYKGNEYYVPLLYMDEKKIFKKDYVYNETCDVVFYNAYKDNKVVGRISGIIQKAANQKWGQKRIRFTRFDSIDDQEVANKLLDAVVEFGKKNGMNELVGPLGYSDLEREGLLIEGFDQPQTYEEQYNYQYYQRLLENYGLTKDVDWVEYQMRVPEEKDERMEMISNRMLERYNLHVYQPKTINEFIKYHIDDFFEIIDSTYERIYGTVPFTDKMKSTMVSNFKLLARPQDLGFILDSNNKAVGFGICFPSISDAVNKSRGYLTLPFIFRFLKAKRHPKVLDLGLIGVLPEYESKGIATMIVSRFQDMIRESGVEYLETNLMLEDNHHIRNLTKHYIINQNKKRRCFKKEI